MLYLGTGATVITPPIGTPLAGFGHRDHGAEEVLDDLEVRVLWFDTDDTDSEAICIITADLIGFGEQLTNVLRNVISYSCGIAPSRIVLSASHTHSGPQTCPDMLGVGEYIPKIVAEIVTRICNTVHSAHSATSPVVLQYGSSTCSGYAVNRRLIVDGNAVFAPNPQGVHDDDVSVITCTSAATGAVRAVLFHYTCHPTTLGDYRISADYPGAARRYIEYNLPTNAIAAFLPGCFADIRPQCTLVGGRSFRKGTADDVQKFGSALGTAVITTLHKGDMRTLTPKLYANETYVRLPMERQPKADELVELALHGDIVQRQWADRILAAATPPEPQLTIKRIDLAEELSLIALGGEVCCDYGLQIKQMQANRILIPLGYSNGLVGYIPSAHMFTEGGYEVTSSGIYYGLAAPFTPAIDSSIMTAINDLLT